MWRFASAARARCLAPVAGAAASASMAAKMSLDRSDDKEVFLSDPARRLRVHTRQVLACEPVASAVDRQPVCMVVGLGGGGIGDACAQKFSKQGYRVAMLARRLDNLKELEKTIPNSRAFACDAADTDSIRKAVAAVEAELGPVDVLIYNAGSGVFKPFSDITEDQLELSWKVNVKGLFAFTQALAPGMIARGSGVIGVTGATASWRGMPFTPAFASSKMGQRGLVQSLARDLAPKGVHVFLMVIDGGVDSKGSKKEELMQPAAIADTYYNMALQPRNCWGWEMSLFSNKQSGSFLSI